MSGIGAYTHFVRNALMSNFGRLDFPYKLTFAVTYLCNYRCKTCGIWQRRPKNELTLEEIQKFFLKSNRFSWIDLTGGEPFLRKDFLDVVEAVLRECKDLLLLHFPTNGYLTDRIVTDVEKMMAFKPARLIITVSTDGDEALNDEVRGMKGGWRRQMETFRQLRKIRGVKTVLGMTLSQHNAGEFERAFEAARAQVPDLDYEDFHVNIAHISNHFYGNAALLGAGDRKQLTEILNGEVKKYSRLRGVPLNPVALLEKRYLGKVERYLRTGITPMRCHAMRASCFLNPTGDVYACGMFDANVGNIRETGYDLLPIWNSEKSVKLQEGIWNYKCPQCWTPCEAYQTIIGNLMGFIRNRTETKTQ